MSGHGTLHDTVGICYQNILPCGPTANVNENDDQHIPKEAKYKRKRAFEPREHVIQPYMKKPKITEFSYEKRSAETPSNPQQVEKRDTL